MRPDSLARAFFMITALAFGPMVPTLLIPDSAVAAHAPDEGFGATATGGAGKPVYRVTNLNDSGPGSFRDAVSQGDRYIVFDVAGEIVAPNLGQATREIYVRGENVTIDGFSAPPPGITLRNYSLRIVRDPNRGSFPNNVIVRGIRIRQQAINSAYDCIGIYGDIDRVLVDHVSLADCEDGALDVGFGARNVTIQWSILNASKVSLLGYQDDATGLMAHRISMHHNILGGPWGGGQPVDRLPRVRPSGGQSTDTLLDFRYNIIRNWWRSTGTKFENGAWGNVVGNTYMPGAHSPSMENRAASVGFGTDTRVYTADNVELGVPPATFDYNTYGTAPSPLPAPPITPFPAACVRDHAGVLPRDERDTALLAAPPSLAALGTCPEVPVSSGTPPPAPPSPGLPDLVPRALSAPSSAKPGETISVSVTIANGGAPAAASSTALYLSTDRALSTSATRLGSTSVPPLAADATHSTTLKVTLPAGIAGGDYMLLLQADDGRAIAESSEANNTIASPLTVGAPAASFTPIFVEAETMSVTTSVATASDPAALGGKYITPTGGQNSTTPKREASVTVNIPSAGTYYLWARMYGPSPAADALYLGIDSSWTRVYPRAPGSYEWVRIRGASGSDGFSLTPGVHTIQMGRGEVSARLDAVYLTNSASDTPAFKPGTEPAPSPKTEAPTQPAGPWPTGTRVAVVQTTSVHLGPAGTARRQPQLAGALGTVGGAQQVGSSWWYFVNFDIGMDGWVDGTVLTRK